MKNRCQTNNIWSVSIPRPTHIFLQTILTQLHNQMRSCWLPGPLLFCDATASHGRSVHPEALKSTLQKLRSFRYQMRSALGGDNLDTPEELAQKGIVSPGGGLALSLGNHANGSAPFTR